MSEARKTNGEKKSYETPKLTTYGDVREITRAVDTIGESDGGGGANPWNIKT